MRTFGRIVGTLAGGIAGLGLLLQAPASAAVPLVGGGRIVAGPGSGSALVNLFGPTGVAATSLPAYPSTPSHRVYGSPPAISPATACPTWRSPRDRAPARTSRSSTAPPVP